MAGITQRKSGRDAGQWVATLYLPNGERKYIYGATRKAVQTKLALFEATGSTKEPQATPNPKSQASTTLRDYSQQWLELQTRQVSPTTVRWRRKHLEHIVNALGNYSLTDITTADVGRFLASLDLHPTTITHIRSTLSVLFSEAVRDRLISYNPVKGSFKPKQRTLSTVEIIPFRDWQNLYHYFRFASTHRLRYACCLLLLTGIRVGELLALNVGDLVTEGEARHWKNYLAINKAMTFNSDGKKVIGYPKTPTSHRKLLLTDEMLAVVEAQFSLLREEGQILGDDSAPLFPSIKGQRLNHKTLWDFWRASIVLLRDNHLLTPGSSLWSLHATRHTVITQLLQKGVPVHDICAWSGHSSPAQIFNTYGHTTKNTEKTLLTSFTSIEDPLVNTIPMTFPDKKRTSPRKS